jgi:soluble lytic murein transglycosylase-like protein
MTPRVRNVTKHRKQLIVLQFKTMFRPLSAALLLCLPLAVVAGPTGTPEPELRTRLAAAIHAAGSFGDRYEAMVWLTDYSARIATYMPDERRRLEFLRLVHGEASRAGLSPELVLSVIHIESRFDRHAISYAGAVGYMQIMPFWLRELGQDEANLFKSETNLRMGCTILRFYLDKERGDVPRALARYNGSLGRSEYPDKVLGVLRERYFAL